MLTSKRRKSDIWDVVRVYKKFSVLLLLDPLMPQKSQTNDKFRKDEIKRGFEKKDS